MTDLVLAVATSVAIDATVLLGAFAFRRRRETEAERSFRRGPGPVIEPGSPTSQLQWPFRPPAPTECPGCRASRARRATYCHRCGRLTGATPPEPEPGGSPAPEPMVNVPVPAASPARRARPGVADSGATPGSP